MTILIIISTEFEKTFPPLICTYRYSYRYIFNYFVILFNVEYLFLLDSKFISFTQEERFILFGHGNALVLNDLQKF